MKRTALIAIMIVALAFGATGFAIADVEDVVVTARVNPAFDMTINQNAVDFGSVAVGATHTDASTEIRVRSNKTWDFSKAFVYDTPDVAPYLSESTDVAVGNALERGVTDIIATYQLDLSDNSAYDLEADVDYQATATYTAVQN